jgi:biopolymer transport protein ExbD
MVLVQIDSDGKCAIDTASLNCTAIGSVIRRAHALDNPRVVVCGDQHAKYSAIGAAVKSINDENMPLMFGSKKECEKND